METLTVQIPWRPARPALAIPLGAMPLSNSRQLCLTVVTAALLAAVWIVVTDTSPSPAVEGLLQALRTPQEQFIKGERVDNHKTKHGYPCTIERVSSISVETFFRKYASKKAVIVEGMDNTAFSKLTSPEQLREDYGDTIVTLASANIYSNGKKEERLATYLESCQQPVNATQTADDTWYFFGDHGQELADLISNYQVSPYSTNGRRSFGIGAHHSGVPFHFHGPAFSEVFHGAKRWFVYPSGINPIKDKDISAVQWVEQVYPKLSESEKPLECVIGPGELLYFPDGWYHATFNLGLTVFMSDFTDGQAELARHNALTQLNHCAPEASRQWTLQGAVVPLSSNTTC
eukprot:g27302.t1